MSILDDDLQNIAKLLAGLDAGQDRLIQIQQLRNQQATLTQLEKIMATLDDVKAAVAAIKDTEGKVVALLDDLHAKLLAAIAANDPAALAAVANDLGTLNSELKAAVERDAV